MLNSYESQYWNLFFYENPFLPTALFSLRRDPSSQFCFQKISRPLIFFFGLPIFNFLFADRHVLYFLFKRNQKKTFFFLETSVFEGDKVSDNKQQLFVIHFVGNWLRVAKRAGNWLTSNFLTCLLEAKHLSDICTFLFISQNAA